ncbi:uncharacterized protein SPSK_03042 [Sporothrix schenckii 1099-18]|uniref:ML-like domain-containing protein n=1 Tax=Sporothrix schenckii 1099-18 TaxID=1397361 RepID=A0A0F2M0H6_SPOSC|nr:uncharacterized protein SPSK_03042 [Sporothrix schenckii 1099-18]KJR82574.1 hypothetical protein SPSK_03042 [Sporothrix schenckii 1099-18]
MARNRPTGLRWLVLAASVCLNAAATAATDILQTTGFNNCGGNDTTVTVQKVDIQYNNANKTVTFDVAGSSAKVQNVTAILNVTAYGAQVYSNSFNPCSASTFVEQLCPVPAGSFAASGSQAIPAEFANQVPAIAFQIPDIAAQATLQLMAMDGDNKGQDVACIQSQVSNGKTTDVPAVSYAAAGIAAAALVLSGVGAVGAAIASGSSAAAAGGSSVAGGMGTISPSFGEVFGWFQGMAMNGMMSVNYPPVYRNFAKNFGFSTGLIPWTQLQIAIDNFRVATGGNLTNDSVQFLQNATLVFPDGSTSTPSQASLSFRLARSVLASPELHLLDRRTHALLLREITTSINGTSSDGAAGTDASTGSGGGAANTVRVAVSGFRAYVEELSIPSASTFMTVLLIVAIVIAAITVGILLVKVVLEAWALFGRFPESLAGFRQHYWRSIARAITTLILLLYGVWVLYCMFQFTQGDSWAAKVLAGVTLGLFTGVLAFFSFRIWYTAQKLTDEEGDTSGLYDDKKIWRKYSLFYESYRRQYWWVFVPSILYMFAKGVALAVGDGHGMAQSIAQLAIEAVMLVMLLWSRPYERRSGNVVNILIQVVRVLSVVCIMVFVEEFGIAETTQTVAGVVLIAVQSALSGILAILIAFNAIVACVKENPHRKRRKELEKARDTDNLTPLDARNSLLQAGQTNKHGSGRMSPIDEETESLSGVSNKKVDTTSVPPASTNLSVPRLPPARQASTVSSTLSASSGAVLIGLASTAPDARSITLNNGNNSARNFLPRIQYSGSRQDVGQGGESLLGEAAPMGRSDTADMRQPTLPNLDGNNTNGGGTYNGPRGPPVRNQTYGQQRYRPGYNGNGPNYQRRNNSYSPFPPQQQQYMAYNSNPSGYGNGNSNFNGAYGPYPGPQRGY